MGLLRCLEFRLQLPDQVIQLLDAKLGKVEQHSWKFPGKFVFSSRTFHESGRGDDKLRFQRIDHTWIINMNINDINDI